MRIGVFRGYKIPKQLRRRRGAKRHVASGHKRRSGSNLGKHKGWLGRPVVKAACGSGKWKRGHKTFMQCALDAVTKPT
jgi:hypothetical protein